MVLTISFVPYGARLQQDRLLEEQDSAGGRRLPPSQLRDAVGAAAPPAAQGKPIHPLMVTPKEVGKDQMAVLLVF